MKSGIEKQPKFRPKYIELYLVDQFTKEKALVFHTAYSPVEMMRGYYRKMAINIRKFYIEERVLVQHNKDKYPSNNLKTFVKFYY